MRKLFQISHKLWVEAQLKSPAGIQKRFIPFLHQSKELLRLRPYLTVHRLKGQYKGNSLTVDYVGLNHKPSFARVLFTEEAQVKLLKRLPIWQSSNLTHSTESDLAVVVGSKYLVHGLPRHGAIVLPFYVQMIMNTAGTWEDVRQRTHKSVRKHELRLIRKYGYEYELSDRFEDFQMFYQRMYKATMTGRHGNLAMPMSLRQAEQYFRYGQLLLIKRENQFVAGGLAYLQGGIVRFELMGVLNGDERLVHEGALGACFYAVVHWANQKGYAEVDFGGAVPRLVDGIFQNKRKWGATVSHSETVHKQIWVKIQRDTPAVRQFFKDTPLITVDESGNFYGLIVTDDPGAVTPALKDEWLNQYDTPGLQSLLIRSVPDMLGASQTNRTQQLIPKMVEP